MELDEISNLWTSDNKIGPNLTTSSLYIPTLHHQYYRIYLNERTILEDLEDRLEILHRDKLSFYKDGPSKEDKKTQKWHHLLPKGVLKNKTELEVYIQADDEMIEVKRAIKKQTRKVDLLLEIIKMIHSFSFLIQNAINDQKFRAGQ